MSNSVRPNISSSTSTINQKKPMPQELSRYVVKPRRVMEGSPKTCDLTPWGLSLISLNYAQGGLLFSKPPPNQKMQNLVDHLRDSLSHTLTHFPNLAGRLMTETGSETPPTYSISINCTNPPGAVFISAEAKDVTVADITAPNNSNIVNALFAFRDEIAFDGHIIPLLGAQVTELADGFFISCSNNHGISDGTSFWNFFQSWSEISSQMLIRSTPPSPDHEYEISHPPIFYRNGPTINLPYSYYSEIPQNAPPPPPPLCDQIFHIPAQSIARLKAQANAECGNNGNKISSFQAFNALLWRCVTRARNLPMDQKTSCILPVNNRPRLSPPLSQEHFGCYIHDLAGTTTVGELLANSLGWSAWLLHEAIVGHNTNKVHTYLEEFAKNPSPCQVIFDNCLLVENSPRFEVYGNDFGLGKPLAVRSGYGNKIDGAVFAFPGREGGGSLDVEVFLLPETMTTLVSDAEFMEVVLSRTRPVRSQL